MRNSFLLLVLFLIFGNCGQNDDLPQGCITRCAPSTPGLLNIAIENRTEEAIRDLKVTIDGTVTAFPLFDKAGRGSYSCWKSYEKVDLISLIEFTREDGTTYQEEVAYEDLALIREYSIEISGAADNLRIQLTKRPNCISDAD
ncbi:MAG: hypothetical protein AAF960_25685 [Bacteroidota bacterium]